MLAQRGWGDATHDGVELGVGRGVRAADNGTHWRDGMPGSVEDG
jgi:hypothetical protein